MILRECAWCGKFLGLATWRPLFKIEWTHGMCPPCEARENAKIDAGPPLYTGAPCLHCGKEATDATGEFCESCINAMNWPEDYYPPDEDARG